ncbi:MAG: bifunctional adenosylcobinamide kinase/adenosylcobinamide-phosphate guanylyltransferase [Rickettsiales bacterium]
MPKITFIIGGARSGKSWHAEQIAISRGKKKIYIATAEPIDEEIKNRILLHQKRRGSEWITTESPIELPKQVENLSNSDNLLLIDCLTLWINNLLYNNKNVTRYTNNLIESLKKTQSDVIIVSNEVGIGITPDNQIARQFRDYAGILHQQIAEISNSVILMVAGIPMVIKDTETKH